MTAHLPISSFRGDASWGIADLCEMPLPGGSSFQARPFHGTKALLFAVLDDGVRSYFSEHPRLQREAAHWIDDPRPRGPFAFVSICDVFGLDAGAVRKSLRQLRDEAQRPSGQVRPRGPRSRRIG